MPQHTPSRRAQIASALNGRSGRRERDSQSDKDRRIRLVAAWLRSLRARP